MKSGELGRREQARRFQDRIPTVPIPILPSQLRKLRPVTRRQEIPRRPIIRLGRGAPTSEASPERPIMLDSLLPEHHDPKKRTGVKPGTLQSTSLDSRWVALHRVRRGACGRYCRTLGRDYHGTIVLLRSALARAELGQSVS